MKKYIIPILVILLYNIYNVLWVLACEYQSEIEECYNANIQWEWVDNITDYVCPNTNNFEEISYQVIFDKKFKVIDKDIENFLSTLQNSIQYYYWPDKKESFLDWINYINELFDVNWSLSKRYKAFCDPSNVTSIIKNYYECTWWDESKKISTINEWNPYISEWKCEELVKYKLFIYKKVAYNLLQVNKLDFLKEFRKKQMKSTREQYDKVIWNMYVNLDNITRINNQRNKVTEQCHYIAPDP